MLQQRERRGLYVEDGVLMREGRAFRSLGVNYLGLFYDVLTNGFDTEVVLKGMEVLAGYGVRVIRVPVNSTYDAQNFRLYFEREGDWFGALDRIVRRAEELGMGLLCSFFWSERVIPEWFGEEVGESIRNPDSKSSRYMEDYVRKFITRYGQSEAVWGWEYGNEIMLEAQLPLCAWKEGKRLFSCDDVAELYRRFIRVIRDCDPYDRFIGSGDAGLRPCSYRACNGGGWEADTPTQQLEMMARLYPMEGISWHEYANTVACIEHPEQLPPSALRKFSDGMGGTVLLYRTWREYMRYLMDTASVLGKVPYIGETAFTHADAARPVTYEENLLVTQTLAQAALDTGFPLLLFWNYDPYTEEEGYSGIGTGWEYSWNERWERGRAILEVIRRTNREMEELPLRAEAL